MKNDNGTACILAWTSLGMNTFGRIRPCGRSKANPDLPSLSKMSIEKAWNSDFYKQLRKDMLNGVKNSNCEKCHVQEKLEGWSKRQEINENRKFDLDKIRTQTNTDGSVDMAPNHIDVRVGNICNLKCVHCWTGNSSKWYEDKILLDKYENTKSYGINNEWISEKGDIWDYIRKNIESIHKLSFLGGEPFASKEHNALLDWLHNNKEFHVEFYYVTNATLLTKNNIDKLKKFKRVTLGISLDAIGEVAEFLRFPMKWKSVEKMFDYLNETNDNKMFEPYFNWTAYNTNIWHLPNTYRYCTEKWPNIDFRLADWVETPKHMSIKNLPKEFKNEIINKMKNVNIHNQQFYLNLMSNEHTWEKYNKTLYNYLNDLDKARATNWRKVLPEIAELWPK